MISYYVLALPLALILAFSFEYGVAGLWVGFTIGSIILDIGFFFVIKCSDWNKIAE